MFFSLLFRWTSQAEQQKISQSVSLTNMNICCGHDQPGTTSYNINIWRSMIILVSFVSVCKLALLKRPKHNIFDNEQSLSHIQNWIHKNCLLHSFSVTILRLTFIPLHDQHLLKMWLIEMKGLENISSVSSHYLIFIYHQSSFISSQISIIQFLSCKEL